MENSSTIVAVATPIGRSALAVVRVSGPDVLALTEKVFGLKNPIPRRANLGAYRLLSGKVFDECVWTYYASPASYTGEDSLEISCHGNPFILKIILNDLLSRGCFVAKPGEFTRRAFFNGKMELTQAEAVSAIISARSESSFNAARRLLSGELGKRISIWNDRILSLLAEIELQIDFSEEEVPSFNVEHFEFQINKLIEELRETYKTSRYSAKVNNGINVVIFGAPNAGKSSLLNAMVGADRAIVSDEAGTTRDFIRENILIGSHCINIIDTAGINACSNSKLELEGINKTWECIHNADFLIFVVDGSEKPPVFEYLEDENIQNKMLIIFNKNDLPAAFDTSAFMEGVEKITLSLLKDKNSVNKLKSRLESILEKKDIVPPDDLLIVSMRHAEALIMAEKELYEAKKDLGIVPIEFISSKLRGAMEDLSEILGNFDNESVLDKVFSGFCIGK